MGKAVLSIWPFSLLKDRPISRLFLVICFNAILTHIFSVIFLIVEKPAQEVSLYICQKFITHLEEIFLFFSSPNNYTSIYFVKSLVYYNIIIILLFHVQF